MASGKRSHSDDGEIGEGSGRLKRSRSLIMWDYRLRFWMIESFFLLFLFWSLLLSFLAHLQSQRCQARADQPPCFDARGLASSQSGKSLILILISQRFLEMCDGSFCFEGLVWVNPARSLVKYLLFYDSSIIFRSLCVRFDYRGTVLISSSENEINSSSTWD